MKLSFKAITADNLKVSFDYVASVTMAVQEGASCSAYTTSHAMSIKPGSVSAEGLLKLKRVFNLDRVLPGPPFRKHVQQKANHEAQDCGNIIFQDNTLT